MLSIIKEKKGGVAGLQPYTNFTRLNEGLDFLLSHIST